MSDVRKKRDGGIVFWTMVDVPSSALSAIRQDLKRFRLEPREVRQILVRTCDARTVRWEILDGYKQGLSAETSLDGGT